VGARLRVDGRELLGFCSNDYLGLSRHPEVIEALVHAAQRGVGSGASHLVSGHSAEHYALEEELADFVGRERMEEARAMLRSINSATEEERHGRTTSH